jgi:hypothetical protein
LRADDDSHGPKLDQPPTWQRSTPIGPHEVRFLVN